MNKLPWFPMFAKDWLVGTMEMTNKEKGAYVDLLCMQWENGSILKVPTRYLGEWPNIKTKFKQNGEGKYYNPRLQEIRDKRDKSLEKQRLGGIESAKIRGKQPTKQPTANQSQSPESEKESEKKEKDIAATGVSATYIDLAQSFLEAQEVAFPKESAWKQFEKRVQEGAKNLELFTTQDKWTEQEIDTLLNWILTDDFWSRQIRTLGGIRGRKGGNGTPMKFENAKAAMLGGHEETLEEQMRRLRSAP